MDKVEIILNNPWSQVLDQGIGIATKLVEKCLLATKEQSAKSLVFYTNHKLLSAANLYKQFGFVEVDITENKYVEADTKMKLVL
jgi:ribosomal protein S18 acetylase RimI-like enzyme